MARKKQEKKLLKVKIPYISIDVYDFEGDLNDIIKYLKNIPNRIKEYDPDNVELEQIDKYQLVNNYNNYDDGWEMEVQAFRWETDQEFNDRIAKQKETERKRKQTLALKEKEKEAEDRKLYEELKKRFENVQDKEEAK